MNTDILNKFHLDNNGIWHSQDKKAISYPEEGNMDCFQIEENSFWFKHRNKVIESLLKRFSPDKTFWDIGGGNGYVALGVQKIGIETVLLEPGEQGCINGKKRGLNNVICSTLEEASMGDEILESAGMFDVIEHIEKDEDFLNTVAKSLKPGSFVYITVPSFNFLWSDEDVYAGHFRRYTTKSASQLLEKSGFEVVYSSYLFSILVLPIFLMRSLPSAMGFKRVVHSNEKNQKEHGVNSKDSISQKMVNKILDWEAKKVNSLKRIPFGSSLLLVGRKR